MQQEAVLLAGLEIKHISKSYSALNGRGGRLPILDDISLSVGTGEIVGVIGPSGSGKTTLLRIVAGLIPADSGQCVLDGESIAKPRRDIAVVFQGFNLFPWRTALRNVEFGLETQQVPRSERRDRARQLLELVGLTGFENHRPDQLSGGMQQRVGLARALAVNPKLLLMDEPMGALDYQTGERLRDEILKIHARTRTSILLISHNIDETIYLSHRIMVLSRRPGRVVKEFQLDFPEPRWEHDLHSIPLFNHVRAELKQLLLSAPEEG